MTLENKDQLYNSRKDFVDQFNSNIKGRWFPLSSHGPHAVGDEFEILMGKTIDNSTACDIPEINMEIKTKFKKGKVTIMCSSPDVPIKELGSLYGGSEGQLVSTVKCGRINNLGLSLGFKDDTLVMIHGQGPNATVVCKWDRSDLSSKLKRKMPNLAMIHSKKEKGQVVYESMDIYENVDIDKFFHLIELGKIVVEPRLYMSKSKGKLIDKGTAFRAIRENVITELFHKKGTV
tara:strand:+ start:187 stop:885 length:699 start_codon:yes stop_codon:yes gene_type:complete